MFFPLGGEKVCVCVTQHGQGEDLWGFFGLVTLLQSKLIAHRNRGPLVVLVLKGALISRTSINTWK